MTCPSCGSEDWKLASLVYQEGLQHIDTRTTSTGVGIGAGGVGLGAARGNTSGIQQSALSQAAAPPEDPGMEIMLRVALILALIGACIGGIISGGSLFAAFLAGFMGGIVGMFIGFFVGVFADKTEYHAQLAAWHKVKMCQRCGGFYRPPPSTPSGGL